MAYEIKITYDGDVPGLAEHRVSIGHFGKPLELLLNALRRIATQMVGSAIDSEPSKVGRFATIARNLDIEITSIVEGSGRFQGVISFNTDMGQTAHLFPDIAERSTVELFDAIERESRGQPFNSGVRNYLKSLPSGLNNHTYDLIKDSATIKSVRIAEIKSAEIPADLPFIRHTEGNIIGVGFEPGRTDIRVKTESGVSVTMSTTSATVEKALEMRRDKVRTITVHTGKTARLVDIKRASEPVLKITPDIVKEHIFNRWDKVLARLAK